MPDITSSHHYYDGNVGVEALSKSAMPVALSLVGKDSTLGLPQHDSLGRSAVFLDADEATWHCLRVTVLIVLQNCLLQLVDTFLSQPRSS